MQARFFSNARIYLNLSAFSRFKANRRRQRGRRVAEHEQAATTSTPKRPEGVPNIEDNQDDRNRRPHPAGDHPVDQRPIWDDFAFTHRVLDLARQRGYSIRELTKGAGTSSDYFTPLAKNRIVGRNTSVIGKLARFLNCHPGFLAYGPKEFPGPADVETVTATDVIVARPGDPTAEQQIGMVAQVLGAYMLNIALDPEQQRVAAVTCVRQLERIIKRTEQATRRAETAAKSAAVLATLSAAISAMGLFTAVF